MQPFKPLFRKSLAQAPLAVALLLVACGGGGDSGSNGAGGGTGGGSGASGGTANRPPSFTSGTTASVVENATGTVYTATATDPENAALTFSIAGGADAARFRIATNGQLTFVDAPNYDLPTDTDEDNVYRVQIAVGDGQATVTQDVAITVTNATEGVTVRRVGTGFSTPVALAPLSDTRVLVAEKAGSVYAFNPQTGTRTLVTQLRDVGGIGVISIAAELESSTAPNRYYVLYVTSANRLVVRGFIGATDIGTTIIADATGYSGGGWLTFETGRLRAFTGDAAAPEASRAQTTTSALGKALTIELDEDLASANSVRYDTLGFHSPVTGRTQYRCKSCAVPGYLFGDSGARDQEEINFVTNSANFGWPFQEGTATLRAGGPANLVQPEVAFPRTGTGRVSGILAGGTIISPPNSGNDRYLFLTRNGGIFTFPLAVLDPAKTLGPSGIERRNADFQPDVGTIDRPTTVTLGTSNTIYVADEDGEIFAVTVSG